MAHFADSLHVGAIALDPPGHYVHWGVVQLSVTNLVVVVLMLVVVALALLLPVPKGRQPLSRRGWPGPSQRVAEGRPRSGSR